MRATGRRYHHNIRLLSTRISTAFTIMAINGARGNDAANNYNTGAANIAQWQREGKYRKIWQNIWKNQLKLAEDTANTAQLGGRYGKYITTWQNIGQIQKNLAEHMANSAEPGRTYGKYSTTWQNIWQIQHN